MHFTPVTQGGTRKNMCSSWEAQGKKPLCSEQPPVKPNIGVLKVESFLCSSELCYNSVPALACSYSIIISVA